MRRNFSTSEISYRNPHLATNDHKFNGMDQLLTESRNIIANSDSARKSKELLANISSLQEYANTFGRYKSIESDDEDLHKMVLSLAQDQKILLNENKIIKEKIQNEISFSKDPNYSISEPLINIKESPRYIKSSTPLNDILNTKQQYSGITEKLGINKNLFKMETQRNEDLNDIDYLMKMRNDLLKDIDLSAIPLDNKQHDVS